MKELKRLEELFQTGIEFAENIRNGEKVVLVYDTDTDGIASAVLVLNVLGKIGKRVKTVPMKFGDTETLKTKLKKFEKIITVDVPIDLIEKNLLSLGKNMLIIDHHPGRDLNSEKTILINPRLERPEIYQPTSYVVYKMFKDLIKEKKWVSILGTVGDMGIEDCKDLVKIRNKKDVWKSKFGKAAMLLTASIAVLGPERTLKILLDSRNLEELVKNENILRASLKFDQELKRCRKEFEKNLETRGKILISKIKPKYKTVCSALITKFATENPEKIIFIFEEKEEFTRIHGRNSIGKIDVGKLFKELGIGGGHREAGAGTIKKDDEEKFKMKILNKLRDFIG
ncbi:MAG: DHH family phosphoesterase [Candidatus Aenigmatarchaeota archaeon]